MASVYMVFAHPHRNQSRVCSTVLKRIRDLDNVTVCDLYESYPDFHIPVADEQAKVVAHDVIFLQHPFYWYNMPPLLKLWIDEVFELGFAYGPGGDAFKGKTLQLSISTGGSEGAYKPDGNNRFTIDEFTRSYDQTAHLCGMTWPKPMVFHSANQAPIEEIEAHAERVRDLILSYTNKLYQPSVQS